MKALSQGKALLFATAASGLALLLTFGLAATMRAVSRPIELPNMPLTADAAQGRHLFLMNCAHCHGDDARGDEGPDLHNLSKTDAQIHQLIANGKKGEMPSFGKKLNDPDIKALTTYLRTLHS